MMTVLMVFVALAFGLMLFSSLQDRLPDELAFLRADTGPGAKVVPGAKVRDYKGWRITEAGNTVEAVKEFKGPLVVNDRTHPAPLVGILCANKKLDARLDTRGATTGVSTTPVWLDHEAATNWSKGTGTNIFPADVNIFVRGLVQARTPVAVTLSYKDLGAQKTELDAAGLAEIIQLFPLPCHP